MDLAITIGQFMLSLSILIVLHELGHFLPAKWFKTKVEKFYLFFDPWFSLWKVKKGDTEYGIGWLPLGGYVKIAGMIDESFDKEQMKQPPQPYEFRSKPAWQRLIIMLGGVTVNFILGIILFGFVLFNWGEEYIPSSSIKDGIYADSLVIEIGLQDGDKILFIGDKPFEKFTQSVIIREIVINDADKLVVDRNGQEINLPIDPKFVEILSSQKNRDKQIFGARLPIKVKTVFEDSPAQKAGVLPNDQIIGIGGVSTPFLHEFVREAIKYPDVQTDLLVLRGQNDTLTFPITLTQSSELGVERIIPYEISRDKYSLGQAIPAGFNKSYSFIRDQVIAFKKMFQGKIKAKESLGSVISIGSMFGSEWRWDRFWNLTAMLSILLGFLNLLPIPALDGGHVMFLLFEVVTGIKPSDRVIEYATLAGFILLILLMVYALGLDISRFF